MKQLTKVSYEQISLQIDKNQLSKIDAMAKKLNLSRSQFVRNCIEAGFGDAVMLNKIGVLDVVRIGRKIVTRLKKRISTGEITFDENGELEIKDKDKK